MVKRLMIAVILFMGAATLYGEGKSPTRQSRYGDGAPTLIVYDFTSGFDDGKMGKWVGEMVWGHAKRSGMYAMVDPITFADLMGQSKVTVTYESDPIAVGKLTKETFGGEYFIWGRVRQKGAEGYVVDFRVYRVGAQGPEKVVEETKDCPGKQFVPGAVDEVLKVLAGIGDPPSPRRVGATAGEGPKEEWRKLGEGLKTFVAQWESAAGGQKGMSEAWKAWAQELATAERKLTSYREEEAANPAILDQLKKLVGDVQSAAGSVGDGTEEGRKRAVAALGEAKAVAGNIAAWLDEGSAERMWKDGKNLVMNGEFTYGQTDPANWDKLPAAITWVANPEPKGEGDKCIRMDVSKEIAETYGMIYYSQVFAIEEGATYRLSIAVKTEGPTPKVWVKTYGEFPEKWGFAAQPREVYRALLNPKPPAQNARGWNTYSREFVAYAGTLNHPRSGRVMLYAYLKPGAIYWDDVVLKKIKDAPASVGGAKR